MNIISTDYQTYIKNGPKVIAPRASIVNNIPAINNNVIASSYEEKSSEKKVSNKIINPLN